MTSAEYAAIQKRCRKFWGTELRGLLPDDAFDDFVQAVTVDVLEGRADGQPLGNVCRSVLRDMRRAEEVQDAVEAHATFEMYGNALPATFAVPSSRWGGPRENSGGPRANSGGYRPGAGSGGPRPGAGRPSKSISSKTAR
jgi:hypothetical protein